jgi:hypothetical protein
MTKNVSKSQEMLTKQNATDNLASSQDATPNLSILLLSKFLMQKACNPMYSGDYRLLFGDAI